MTSPVPRRAYAGKSAELRRAERRERLLAAGLELFGTGEYAAASVERMCDLAGLSTRQFYMEFDNRDSVLLALYDRVNDRAETVVNEVAGRDVHDRTGLREMLRLALAAYITAVAGDPRCAKVAFTVVVGVNPRIEAHRRDRRRRWVEQLTALATEAAVRAIIPGRDFDLLMTAFIGAVNGLVHDWSVTEPRAPIDEVADTLAHLLYSALSTA